MKTEEQLTRGVVNVMPPGFGPVGVSAVEQRGIGPHLAPMNATGPLWMLLVMLTPARITVFPRGGTACLEFPAGSAVLLPRNTRYRVDTRPARTGSHHFWMQIENIEKEPRLLAMIDDATGCARFSDPTGALADRLAALVEAAVQQQSEPFWVVQAHGGGIIRLLSDSVRNTDGVYRIDPNNTRPAPDVLVSRAIDYLQKNLAGSIRLADLARHLHASPSAVSHRYRAATGEAPIQTLRRMRLPQAKAMLVKGSSLREIAAALGYYDEHHFSRAFKKTETLTPLQFARQAGVNRPAHGPVPK